jgi:hypothetical protein
MTMATSKKKTVNKSSSTGKFVRTTTVERHPEGTVAQTVRKPKSKPPKKSGK